MTEAEAIERLKAACERIRLLGRPGQRPAYDPGAPVLTATPKPLTTAVPPSHHETDRDPGEEG